MPKTRAPVRNHSCVMVESGPCPAPVLANEREVQIVRLHLGTATLHFCPSALAKRQRRRTCKLSVVSWRLLCQDVSLLQTIVQQAAALAATFTLSCPKSSLFMADAPV